MPAEGPPSEYGGKIQRNTVMPKDPEALTAGEQLRLVYRTGTENPDADPDEDAFIGGRL